jgi:hypothetical protein
MHMVVHHSVPSPNLITTEYLEYNKSPLYLAVISTLVSVALLTFLLRVYSRLKILRFFGIDDWLMLMGAVCIQLKSATYDQLNSCKLCALADLIIFTILVRLGFGKHLWAISPHNVISIGPLVWAFTLIVVLGICFVKLSVAFFLLRIIQLTAYRRLLYCSIGT